LQIACNRPENENRALTARFCSVSEEAFFIGPLTGINWRGQRGPKPNFLKQAFIWKTRFVPAFFLTLDLFRVTGYEGEKFLLAVPGTV